MTLNNAARYLGTVLAIVSVFLITTPAQAFRSAAIATDSVELKQTADPNSPTLSILARGTRLNTSDEATNGYFKVRSANATGWVKTGDLYFYTKPGQGARKQAKSSNKSHARKYTFVVKGFAGADFWSPGDINTLTGSTALSDGTGVGFEIGYVLGVDTTLVLRVEHLSKSSSGTDSNNPTGTAVPISLDFSATPIMVGMDYRLIQWDGWSLEGSGLIGLASPSLSGSTNGDTPTVFSGSAFTLLVKLDLNWEFSDTLWLYSELGYRYLQTGEVEAPVYNDTFLESQATPPAPVPISLNMSGPIFDIGLRLNL